jgi:hypothetical protein
MTTNSLSERSMPGRDGVQDLRELDALNSLLFQATGMATTRLGLESNDNGEVERCDP